MKTYEDYATGFATGKEFSRAEVEEMVESMKRYHETLAGFIEGAERMFLIAGEMCEFQADKKEPIMAPLLNIDGKVIHICEKCGEETAK